MPHTPGPWAIREPDPLERAEDIAEGVPPEEQELTEVYAEEGGNQVCYVMNDTPDEQANARLIAAAPDLLHCVLLLDYACHHGDGECLEAAVAKAKTLIAAAGQKTAEEEEDEEEEDEEEDQ
jgi:hypothetical protein